MKHTKSLQVGNGSKVATLFVVPIIISIHGHKFEIFTLVSEIQDTIDLVFVMKNMHEVEGEHSARHSEFRFLNRTIAIFPEETFTLKPGGKRYVKVVAPFIQQLSGVAIVRCKDNNHAVQIPEKSRTIKYCKCYKSPHAILQK